MPSQIARLSWRLTLPLFALLTLAGCGTPRVVFREVKVPVPVRAPLDPRLTADCPPDVEVPPTGPLPAGAALERLEATEAALARCRAQLDEIRLLDKSTGG